MQWFRQAEAKVIINEKLDLKPDNIMLHIENQSVMNDFVANQSRHPPPRHTREDDHVVYHSQNDFGPLQELMLLPAISEFDLAVSDGMHLQPTQTHRHRAPEVILGTGWSYSADIWNLGLMLIAQYSMSWAYFFLVKNGY